MPRVRTAPGNPAASIYERLRDVGLKKQYVKKFALPDWWDDSLAANPAGFAQFLIILSRHLGVELASLQDPRATVRLQDFGDCKYKKRSGTSNADLQLSRVIATRAAQIAGAGMANEYRPVPTNASEVRQGILGDAPWVGFEELLDYCWSVGIPVIHVSCFPPGAKRADGFTMRLDGRPVIVLCRNDKQPSWQLFILAHELGHIACNHVPEHGALLDEVLGDNVDDEEEKQADRYAIEILTGKPTMSIGIDGRWPNARKLADLAMQFARLRSIDPGHIVLNYAHTMGDDFYAVARGALKLLYPNANAMDLVRTKLAENLDWELLPEDSSEFLMRITTGAVE